MKNIYIALTLVSMANLSIADEHYGIQWSKEHSEVLAKHGYDPKDASRVMYEANDLCSKSISDIEKKNQFLCVEYRCGFNKKILKIDTYTNKAKVDDWCF